MALLLASCDRPSRLVSIKLVRRRVLPVAV
jgi:hypothetical protein